MERLADRHGKVMDSMITDLQNIAFKGCGMRCAEQHYQEQNDHPLTYLVATLGLSLPATTVLAYADKDTLEELAMKVADQRTEMENKEEAARELKALRQDLREDRNREQMLTHHSDVRLRDLQSQMTEARTQLARLEYLSSDPIDEWAAPAQAGPPTPSEETTRRVDPPAEYHCLHCGMPAPFTEVKGSDPEEGLTEGEPTMEAAKPVEEAAPHLSQGKFKEMSGEPKNEDSADFHQAEAPSQVITDELEAAKAVEDAASHPTATSQFKEMRDQHYRRVQELKELLLCRI